MAGYSREAGRARAGNRGPVDILLVGDSITQQWGSVLDGKPLNAAWQKHFGRYQTINLGIGGDKTQNALWRLDHGGVAGLESRPASSGQAKDARFGDQNMSIPCQNAGDDMLVATRTARATGRRK